MQSIIFATGYSEGLCPLADQLPSPLFRLVGRPMIVHVLESLVQRGVTKVDLVLHHLPELIEETLGDGKRWGVEITYHLARDAATAYSLLPSIARTWGCGKVLLGQADTLPDLGEDEISEGWVAGPDGEWSGWAFEHSERISAYPRDLSRKLLEQRLKETGVEVRSQRLLSVQTFADIKRSNLELLNSFGERWRLPASVKEVEPGIWLSSRSFIDPGCELRAPVLIGEGSQIKEGAIVGPGCVVEDHCVIDQGSVVRDSIVLANTYVGEALDIKNSLLGYNHLIHLSLDTAVPVHDEFILSTWDKKLLQRSVGHWAQRGAALFLAVVLLPLIGILYLIYSHEKRTFMKLPRENHGTHFTWHCLQVPWAKGALSVFSRLPLIFNIIRGQASLVGISLRSEEEISALPADFQQLVVKSKCGLITKADAELGKDPSLEEIQAAESLYIADSSLFKDSRICFRLLKSLIT